MTGTDFRVRFKDAFGRVSGEWVNFPTEVRARTFAAQAMLNDPSIWTAELTIKSKGTDNEQD